MTQEEFKQISLEMAQDEQMVSVEMSHDVTEESVELSREEENEVETTHTNLDIINDFNVADFNVCSLDKDCFYSYSFSMK